MNIYDSFFRGMSHEEWEFFSIDFLVSMGYSVERFPSRGPDGGKDGIVSTNNKKYLVSCKHFVTSGEAVGVKHEPSILDRILQHETQGFIGVYATVVSTSLDERFTQLTKSGYECISFDANKISNFLPKMSSHIIQKYGLPNHIKYVLNVPDYEYKPLPCLGCGVDILNESMITSSMASICVNNQNELEYIYGCKKCIAMYNDVGFVVMHQVLHPEQLLGWINWVSETLNQYPAASDFYKTKNDFESAIQQRMFPSNWGRWASF